MVKFRVLIEVCVKKLYGGGGGPFLVCTMLLSIACCRLFI